MFEDLLSELGDAAFLRRLAGRVGDEERSISASVELVIFVSVPRRRSRRPRWALFADGGMMPGRSATALAEVCEVNRQTALNIKKQYSGSVAVMGSKHVEAVGNSRGSCACVLITWLLDRDDLAASQTD